MNSTSSPYIRWFSDIGIGDVGAVGGKNASLGEMYRELSGQGVRVPNGFAVTAQAYKHVLEQGDGWLELHKILKGMDVGNVADLARRAHLARELIYGLPLPADLAEAILEAYGELQDQYGEQMSVAVRSSATAEDLPTASFAGQHETFLNLSGGARLIDAVKRCYASLFTDRAVRYRTDRGFDHLKVYLSVGVMKMVRSDLASSGVMFTLDTETGFRDVVFITGAYGLGENVVQGTVDPDEFHVFKPTFLNGHRTVLRRSLGGKEVRMVYASAAGRETTRNVPTSDAERTRYCLEDEEVLRLADYALAVERHYSARSGADMPMDLEWAKDGVDGHLYIVQARPETVAARKISTIIEEYSLVQRGEIRAKGRAVGNRLAAGPARVIRDVSELPQFRPGEVLVADTTTPDWGTVMKTAAAVVTNRGGRTCHSAIVARETGIPAVVGCGNATERIQTGDEVTVSCVEGDVGYTYAGRLPYRVTHTDLRNFERSRTQLMLNLGNPDIAFRSCFLPADGIGLARLEFIVAEHIRVHPMALVHPERVADKAVADEIARLTRQYARPEDYFVRTLSEGVGTIAAAFYPRPVIVRMSDFKTNEYASLLGGRWFEPLEANPMIGFRGASRYAHPAYREGFALECRAMKRVRHDMGLDNVRLMIPFCRRIAEAEAVLACMAEEGLRRGEDGLEVYVMCEIPNNVLQVGAFSRLFDGFSIGSNDLTQLVLGVDRDSEIVAFDFDERDEGVKMMIRMAIEGARANGKHCGICGQAPSDYPDFAKFLVEQGIDSISLNPDTLISTSRLVLEVEQWLAANPGTRRDTA